MLTGGVIAAVVAAMTVPVPGHAVGDHTAVFRAGYRSYTSASCHPDREVNITGPVEKAYRDPVGDAVAGHGDITGAWISDLRGVVTFKIDVKNMPHDLLVIDFDTNCDDYEDYLVGVYGLRTNGGSVELYRFNGKERFPSRAPTIVRTRSRRTVGATTYTFRFSSSRFGGTTAFRFKAHMSPPTIYERSDWAPDNKYDYWYYDLLSR
jgi:hypothetical protein